MNARNVLILSAAVVGGLIILGFLSTILNAIVPLTIVAVVAFMLGRMSVNTNLLQVGMNLASRAAKSASTVQAAAKPAEAAPVQQSEPQASKKPLPQTGKLAQTERLDAAKLNIKDFEEIKSSEQVLADSKKLEDELTKKNAEYDPTAALEERRRRLLNDKKDE